MIAKIGILLRVHTNGLGKAVILGSADCNASIVREMQGRYGERGGRRSWTVVQARLAYQGEEAPETPAGAAATTM